MLVAVQEQTSDKENFPELQFSKEPSFFSQLKSQAEATNSEDQYNLLGVRPKQEVSGDQKPPPF